MTGISMCTNNDSDKCVVLIQMDLEANQGQQVYRKLATETVVALKIPRNLDVILSISILL
jgi:hypothetical protein